MVGGLVSESSSRPGFEPWPGTLLCSSGQETLLLHCLSPLGCIKLVGTDEFNVGINPAMD